MEVLKKHGYAVTLDYDMDVFNYQFLQNAVVAGILAGIGCSLIGVLVVSLRMPFLGVSMAHAGFAGAVLGILTGVDPLICAFVICCLTGLFIGPVADKAGFDPELSIGVVFSFMIGCAFLLLSLIPGAKTQALALMWGSILSVSGGDLCVIAVSTLVTVGFIVLFFRPVTAVLFDRKVAASLGIPARRVYYTIIFLSAAVVSANMTTIGGLLIFSLIVNPAAASFQIARNFKGLCILSCSFGVVSCMAGLAVSFLFNVPAGAVIIIVSSVIFGICLIVSPKKRTRLSGGDRNIGNGEVLHG